MLRMLGLLFVVAIVLFVAVAPKGLTDQTFAPVAQGLQAASQQSVLSGSLNNSVQAYGQQVKGASIDLGNAATKPLSCLCNEYNAKLLGRCKAARFARDAAEGAPNPSPPTPDLAIRREWPLPMAAKKSPTLLCNLPIDIP